MVTAGNEWQGKGNCAECRRREYCKKECTARKKLVQHFSGVTMKRLMQEQGYFTAELLSSANAAINTGMNYGKDDAAPEEIVKRCRKIAERTPWTTQDVLVMLLNQAERHRITASEAMAELEEIW